MQLKLISVLAMAAIAPVAQATVSTFADSYKTNSTGNTTTATNTALNLLKGYSTLWTTGSSWDNGSPTMIGAPVVAASQAYVVNITHNRTDAQALQAYLTDRRDQSFSAINGLGALSNAYRTAANATTTIQSTAADALTAKYEDKGTGPGNNTSGSVGSIIQLVGTLRGSASSSTPAKNYFNSPRPWRSNDAGVAVQSGTETTSFHTATNSTTGLPEKSAPLTSFPLYTSKVVVVPSLLAVRGTTPATDGGFVSGHTNAAYLASFAMAYAIPTSFQDMLRNASQMGEDRIVSGMHSPLDVMGGRVLATALSASILSDTANASLKTSARAQGKSFVAANTTETTSNRFSDFAKDTSAQHAADKATYAFRMTYGLPATTATTTVAVVPKGADVLLETRQSYLSAEQRREVLRTTAMPSGNAVADDAEGWGRLNLFAAADGYGRFDSQVVVSMDAANGGYDAKDAWRNDIVGNGGLTKNGSGQLALTGTNSYSGGTVLNEGTLVAESATAFGVGDVSNLGGRLVVNAHQQFNVRGNFAQMAGTLELSIPKGASHKLLSILGSAKINGGLHIVFEDGYAFVDGAQFNLITADSGLNGTFSNIRIDGLPPSFKSQLRYSASGLSMHVSADSSPAKRAP